jgi:hypothetical protein
VTIEFRPHQPTELTMPDRHQSSQCAVVPSVTTRHQNLELAAIDDDSWSEALACTAQRRPLRTVFSQKLVESWRITYPKSVCENLGPRFGTEAYGAPKSVTSKAQTRRWELRFRAHEATVDTHLERMLGPVAAAKKRCVAQYRGGQ